MGVRAEVTVTSNTDAVYADIEQGLIVGENKAAERLLALSAVEVPLDLGILLGSGQVLPATDAEHGAGVVYDTPYAARLHEHPEYNFQNGRKGKYLEDPALENRDELAAIVMKEAGGA